jgi:CubicO group peptidase (beta-lactamase class C family)
MPSFPTRDYITLLGLAGYDDFEPTTQALALDVIARQQSLDFPTGSRYAYSNSGYILLARVIERVTGQTLNRFLREHVFDPLDMPTAVLRDRHALPIPNLALGYAADDVGGFEVSIAAWEQVGDGALHLSMDEAQKWDENFFTGQVGGSSFASEMYRRGALDDGRALDYASGLKVDSYRGLQRVLHGGDGTGYHSQIVRFPEQHATVSRNPQRWSPRRYRLWRPSAWWGTTPVVCPSMCSPSRGMTIPSSCSICSRPCHSCQRAQTRSRSKAFRERGWRFWWKVRRRPTPCA